MRTETFTASNGLDVVLVEHRVAPVVAIEVWVRVGAADERPDQCGLAHVHEHMIFKGTARRGAGDIARDVEAAGGDINARTSFDYTVYHIEMSSRFFESGLETLADALQNPAFDPEELARELEVIVEEIKRSDDSPGHTASQRLFETAFAGHPYGRRITGSVEDVRSFTRDKVLEFFSTWYVPANMSLVVVGDFALDEARALVARHFDAPPAPAPERGLPRPTLAEPPPRPAIELLRRDTRESHLHLAFDIPGIDHADVPALDVLAIALGGTTSSRLEVRIKQELGLVNAIGTYAYTPLERGLFTVSATFQLDTEDGDDQESGEPSGPRSPREVAEAVLLEVLGYASTAISPEAIARVRTLIACQTVYEKQAMRGLAQKFGFYRCLLGDLEAERAYFEAVAAVDVEDVRRVAARYLVPERLTLVLLSPEDEAASADLTADEVRQWIRDAALAANRRRTPAQRDARGIVRSTIEDGPLILIEPTRDTGLVSLWISMPGGKRHEDASEAGVTQLMASLMTRGTTAHSAVGLAEAFESMGGGVSVYAGHNTLSLSATFLAEHVHRGVELVAECLLEPAFEASELERERQLQLEDLRAMADQGSAVAFRQLARELYGPHPYARSSSGTLDTVPVLDEEAVRRCHARCLARPERVATLVGDLDPELGLEIAATWLRWPVEEAPPLVLPEPTRIEGARLVTSELPGGRQQAHVVVGFHGARLDEDERHVLEVIAAILSGQGGRLFRELRDKQSLAYSVSAFNRPDLDRGYFGLYVATSAEKVPRALEGLGRELRRLVEAPLEPGELARAHRYLVGSNDVSLQQGSTRASLMTLSELYGMGYDHHLGYADRIRAVDEARLVALAARWLLPEQAVVSVVHPPGIEVSLEPFLAA